MTIIFIIIGTDIPKWYIPPETQSSHLLPPCTVSMFNYNEHKRVDDDWHSVPFYSGIDGYKLYLRVDADGYDTYKGTHVSVYAGITKGENDERLQWPFNGEITIELLNWREDKGHVEKIIDHYNAPIDRRKRVTDAGRADPRGHPDFISFADLGYNPNANTEYLHNDTLCFRVSKVIIHTGNKTYCILYNITYMYTYRPFVVT